MISPASAQQKPSLAAEIRSVLQSDGVEAAQRRFDVLYPEHKGEYDLDPEGFAEMGTEAMQRGDMETGQAIMQMVQRISQDMLAEEMGNRPPGTMRGGVRIPTAQDAAEAERRREEERAAEQQQAEDERAAVVRERLGEPRDDLQRFAGIYGDPDAEPARDLFVAVRCDGYLIVGATWGDAQDWHLRSLSDLEFEAEAFGGEAIRFRFTLGGDGRPSSMTHSLDFLETPLPYRQSLQEFGWPSECVEPRGG
jgi:hypothetical protein